VEYSLLINNNLFSIIVAVCNFDPIEVNSAAASLPVLIGAIPNKAVKSDLGVSGKESFNLLSLKVINLYGSRSGTLQLEAYISF